MQAFTFYTREQTADILGLSPRQVARAAQSGRLGSTKFGTRTLHSDEQIAAYVAACTREPVAS